VLGRILDVHTDERAWRVGAEGEELVGRELAATTRRDPRWQFLHSIPIGTRGSDIDHIAIGPGGVFTINTKHHPGARLWVGGGTFIVNGQRQPYVRNARYEAQRVSRLLSTALGAPLTVAGMIVPVRCRALVVKTPPLGVLVIRHRDLRRWSSTSPGILAPGPADAAAGGSTRNHGRPVEEVGRHRLVEFPGDGDRSITAVRDVLSRPQK
jgi:hypothetical protein